MKWFQYALLLSIAILLSACSSKSVQTDRPYQELGRAQHFQLHANGYLIGIEKIVKSGDVPLKNLNNKDGYQQRFRALPGNDELTKERNNEFHDVTAGQIKVMLASQVTRNFPQLNYIYNAFEKDLDGQYDYEKSFSALDILGKDLAKQLKTNRYSHIIVMSMGWNNDQVESVWRYNKLIDNMAIAARMTGHTDFNPLVIGFTWPSAWATISDSWLVKKMGHLFSYGNKANDADEIGFTLANWVVNKVIPKALDDAFGTNETDKAPHFVIIGHSFGARLTSRALYSSAHIKPVHQPQTRVDLFLGLQGAFSANRFIPGGGSEGHPYSNLNQLDTRVVLTTSVHDKANPVAHWVTRASHVGGTYGLEKAKSNPEVFDVVTWDHNNYDEFTLPENKVLMVDASEIVNEVNRQGMSGHNDIVDIEMGQLIWHFIDQLDNQ